MSKFGQMWRDEDSGNAIFKTPVMGIAIVKENNSSGVIYQRYLTMTDMGPDTLHLENDEILVSVIPAPPGMYEVWGFQESTDRYETLGYIIPGEERKTLLQWHEIFERTFRNVILTSALRCAIIGSL